MLLAEYKQATNRTAICDGARRHEQVSVIAQGPSEEGIVELAAWHSSIAFTGTLPN
jgi:hypothetical protein